MWMMCQHIGTTQFFLLIKWTMLFLYQTSGRLLRYFRKANGKTEPRLRLRFAISKRAAIDL